MSTSETRPLIPASPVGGSSSEPSAGAMSRILDRITDDELRQMLSDARGGQFARAVAAEIDVLHSCLANNEPSNATGMMTDVEAHALEKWLLQHFSLTGRPPQPGERLVTRVMLTLHGMVTQLQELQRALAERPSGGTPVE